MYEQLGRERSRTMQGVNVDALARGDDRHIQLRRSAQQQRQVRAPLDRCMDEDEGPCAGQSADGRRFHTGFAQVRCGAHDFAAKAVPFPKMDLLSCRRGDRDVDVAGQRLRLCRRYSCFRVQATQLHEFEPLLKHCLIRRSRKNGT